MTNETATVPMWICTHCYIHLVNGDCTETDTCEFGAEDENDPLWKFGDMEIAPGMAWENHADECNAAASEGRDECDCETNTFGTSACEGCGSPYHGERHAVTGWTRQGA